MVGSTGMDKNSTVEINALQMTLTRMQVIPHPESTQDPLFITFNPDLVYVHSCNRNIGATGKTWVQAWSLKANGRELCAEFSTQR